MFVQVSASGQTVTSQGTSGQVISHAVIAKGQAGTTQTRVIPQQALKQTIQVNFYFKIDNLVLSCF